MDPNISDDMLQIYFLDGDSNKFPLIYDRYARPLYGIIIKMVNDHNSAEEILQEVFLKIWKNKSKFNPNKSKLFTWMYSIARNTTLDFLRSRNRQTPSEITINNVKPNIETIDVFQKVNDLENKYSEVLNKIYFEGYTHLECSKELNLPLGTIKSRVKIALRSLKKIYMEQGVLFLTFFNQLFI